MSRAKSLIPAARASTLAEFRPIASESLSVFSAEAILGELETLQKLLELPKKPEAVDFTEEEWRDTMDNLIRSLGASQFDPMTGYPRILDEEDGQHALAGRILQARRAVDHATRTVDSDGGATGLLLPTAYARRIEVLLGTGVLPLAWVRQLDVLRF